MLVSIALAEYSHQSVVQKMNGAEEIRGHVRLLIDGEVTHPIERIRERLHIQKRNHFLLSDWQLFAPD